MLIRLLRITAQQITDQHKVLFLDSISQKTIIPYSDKFRRKHMKEELPHKSNRTHELHPFHITMLSVTVSESNLTVLNADDS